MKIPFAVLVLFASSVGWGLTWLPIKTLTEAGLHSMHLVLIAFLSGALLLSPWLIKHAAQWRHSIKYMILVALAGGIANASFQTAMAHGDVVRVMILFYLLPVWSVIGGRIFLREHIDGIRMLAIALCLSGAFVILDVWHNAWHSISWIDGLALLSGMGLAATNILFRFTPHISVISKVAAMFIGCTIIIGGFLLVLPANSSSTDSSAIVGAVLYGVIWLTLITFGTQWGVTQMEAGRSAVIIVMELVAAVISVALLTSAGLHSYEIIGGLMVLSAALLEGARGDVKQPERVAEQNA